jgi:DNA-binding SARP family transcriptional activator
VELGVLGPIELRREGECVALGGGKQRLALGLLTAWRGRVVPVDALIDGLWPEGAPVRPRKTVQLYVTRLRQALGLGADAIRSESAGYRLDPTVVTIDADAFEQDVQAAMSATGVDRAISGLRVALGRWRGDAFVDLRECAAIVPSAVHLDERRLKAMYELYDREVQVRPRDVLAELEQVVEANPLREDFVAQLMTAQYRSSRHSDALATYQRLRQRLIEVGLDTGQGIRELEARIVRHELDVAPRPESIDPMRQRRRVTVVSSAVTVEPDGTVELDPEEEFATAAALRRAARARIVERGGVVLADVGGELSACFGYPASEDSPQRAVAAALAVRDLATSAGPGVTIRVAADTGVVILEGVDGERDHGELTGIAGPLLRSAAQLRALASAGEVRLGQATAIAVAGSFVFDCPDAGTVIALGPMELEPARSGSERLFGRDGHLAELASIAANAGTRFCGVLVAGPPGIGKSAVVESFAAGLDPSWAVLRVRCGSRQLMAPLDPFRRLLPELFEGSEEPRTGAIVRQLQERWAGRRPVLVVEDVHDADASTLDVLDELPVSVPAGLLVMTSRSWSPIRIGGDAAPTIVLAPLDRATARALAKLRAGSERLPNATLNEIAVRSGGIPLHVIALTEATVASRADSPDGRTASPAVPDSLYDSLMARLDRVGSARTLAQRCAVLGDPFVADDLALVDDGRLGNDSDGLATLVEAGVLRLEDGRYRFTHALLAEAAYNSLLNTERVALHSNIAEALSSTADRSEPERLAYHLEGAGRRFEGAVAWRRASGRALARGRPVEAHHHARRALALFDQVGPAGWSDGGDSRRSAILNLARSLTSTTHGSEELTVVIEEARRSGVGIGDWHAAMSLDLIDIINTQALGNFQRAADVARRLLETVRARGDERAIAIVEQSLGATLVWRGELSEGAAFLHESLEYWERTADLGQRSLESPIPMWTMLALVAAFEARFNDAENLFDHARGHVVPDDDHRRCMLGSMVAMVDQLAGRADKVREEIEPLWSLATDVGSDFWVTWTQVLLGWAVAEENGPSGCALMIEAIDGSSTRQLMPYANFLLGSRLCAQAHVADGLARLANGVDVARATGEELWLPMLELEQSKWLSGRAALTVRADAVRRAKAAGATLIVEWAANRFPG